MFEHEEASASGSLSLSLSLSFSLLASPPGLIVSPTILADRSDRARWLYGRRCSFPWFTTPLTFAALPTLFPPRSFLFTQAARARAERNTRPASRPNGVHRSCPPPDRPGLDRGIGGCGQRVENNRISSFQNFSTRSSNFHRETIKKEEEKFYELQLIQLFTSIRFQDCSFLSLKLDLKYYPNERLSRRDIYA